MAHNEVLLGATRDSSVPCPDRPSGTRRAFYYAYLACLLGLNGVVLLPNDGVTDGGSSPLFSASWVLVHVVSMIVLLTAKRRTKGLPVAVLFGVYAASSALWSVDPGSSLLYGGMLTGNILIAYVLANEASPREILRLIAGAIVILSVAGIIAYYAGYGQVTWFDTRGRTNVFGGEFLRGFFPHRIAGSLYATIGIVAVCNVYTGIRRLTSLGVLLLYMLLSASATGFVLLGVAGGVWVLTSAAAKSRTTVDGFVVSRGVIGLLIAPIVWFTWAELLNALGRDATLTGRTILWSWGLDAWQERPIFGWGYYAYFQSQAAQIKHQSIPELRYYEVPHFHEAYIQTSVDIGLAGLAGLLIIIATTVVRSYRYSVESSARDGESYFTISIVLAVGGFAIFIFPEYNHFSTFLLFVLYFSMRAHGSPRSRGRRAFVPNLSRQIPN